MKSNIRIGLSLSGGGVRAMAFHSGVLRWLAETRQLESISHISSVSGGSLLVGLIFNSSNWHWPSSSAYLDKVHNEIRKTLTESDLQNIALRRLLLPRNWKYILSRANILSQTIEKNWGIDRVLAELPESPIWSINGTTAETGRRFNFKRTECGDYEFGYTDSKNIKIADAMATSAAYPVGIGPFVINTNEYQWVKQSSYGDSSTESTVTSLPYHRLHLYDGGIYDNLGVEPLFDIGRRKFKSDIDYMIVSDAGRALERQQYGSQLNPFRVKRIADIALDQTRALRVRSFINFIQNNTNSGAYLQIGADAKEKIETNRDHNEDTARSLLEYKWLGPSEVNITAKHETNLHQLTLVEFERLTRHGYETARWNELLFAQVND